MREVTKKFPILAQSFKAKILLLCFLSNFAGVHLGRSSQAPSPCEIFAPSGKKILLAPLAQIVQVDSHTYHLTDAENPQFYVWGEISNEKLGFDFYLKASPWFRSKNLKGKEEFDRLLSYFDGHFEKIIGNWWAGDNLIELNRLTGAGEDLESASLKTWTGQQALRYGYTKVEIKKAEGTPGHYTGVQVLFSLPEP